MSVNSWIDARIKAAVDEAVADAKADLTAEIQAVEQNLTAQITSLPGLLGAQIQNVALDAGAVAAKVISGVATQLAQFPQQVVQGILQGLPFPFKGQS